MTDRVARLGIQNAKQVRQEIEELYQEVILDHSRRPRNFGELPDAAVRYTAITRHVATKFISPLSSMTGGGLAGYQVHRTRMRHQSGVGVIDDDETEGEKPPGSDGNAPRIPRSGDK